ncbi:MAG: hypothetical protein IAE97_01450 [Chthoniobacterales bacterium]|nr:hypothetical protein [Chthoniobacterales bacterium]
MMLAERLLHVFHWPAKHQIRLLLPAMVLASLLVHAAGIYLVRAPAPAREIALPPLPAKIGLLPVADSVLLAARDPSWIRPGRFRDRMLPAPPVRRMWRALDSDLPPLVPVPPEVLPQTWVPSLPPLADSPRFEPGMRPAAPELAPLTARFDQGGPAVTEDVLSRLRSAAPLQPPGVATELLVVLDPAGEARHVWLLRSCGVPALDFSARRAVQLSRFGPSAQGHRGVLRINWGVGGPKP